MLRALRSNRRKGRRGRRAHRAALALAAFAGLLLLAPTASAGTLNGTLTPFTGSPAHVDVTLDDMIDPGSIVLTVAVVSPLADLRGVWLNISDESLLPGLSASGPDVTGAFFEANAVNDLGGGANLNGGGTPCPCDIGIAIGTPGIGKDDISMTTITLSHDTEALGISLFAGSFAGVRLTSVSDGKSKKGRDGSSKLTGVLVPEPGTATLTLVGLTGLAIAGRRRRRRS